MRRVGRPLASANARLLSTRAAGGGRPPPPSLKQYMLSVDARKLYRDVLRSLRGIDEGVAADVRSTAREQFADNCDETDTERARPRPRQRTFARTPAAPRARAPCAHPAGIRILLIDGRASLDNMKGLLESSQVW